MYSVELYRRLEAGEFPGRLDRERRHQARVVPRAARGDPAADQLGPHLRPAAARDLARRGRRALPARRSRRRASARPTSSRTGISTRPSCATRWPIAPGPRACAFHLHTRVTGIDVGRRAGRAVSAPTGATSTARSSSTAAACSPPRSAGWPACASRSSRWRTSTSSPSRSASRATPRCRRCATRTCSSTSARRSTGW